MRTIPMKWRNTMNLHEALDSIQTFNRKFPKEALEVISAHKEEALPVMRESVRKTAAHPELVDDYKEYFYFYATFFLGEFRDTESFPDLIRLISMPSDRLNDLYNDAITSGLPDILYCTFNGDTELLKTTGMNLEVDLYMRAGILDVLAKLCLDGKLDETELKDYLRQYIRLAEKDDPFIYSKIADVIVWCHFRDMLPDLKELAQQDLLEGDDYPTLVDLMYTYNENDLPIESPIKVSEYLQSWGMYDSDSSAEETEGSLKDLLRSFLGADDQEDEAPKAAPPKIDLSKIGRNDPCPCGSGKKYKNCCLGKPVEPLDTIESQQSRDRVLAAYPPLGGKRIPGRLYLADFYDAEAIEIDRLLYLALQPRELFSPYFKQYPELKKIYLHLAYSKFAQKCAKDHIRSFAEYDQKYAIHYDTAKWFDELMDCADPEKKTMLLKHRAMLEQ